VSANSKVLPGAAPLPERRIPAAVHDADRRVREMVARAEEEARRVREDAQTAREAIRAEAIEEGRREGLARAAAALAAAAAERDRRLAAVEREVMMLALDVARKILGRELAERAGAIADLAALALREARERRDVVLRVNPADARSIRAEEGRLAALLLRAPLQLREDPTVPAGAAVVDTEAGRIDAGIEAQLAALGRALEEALPS